MVLDARKRWTLYVAMTARIVLASTLLLSAYSLIFQPSLCTKMVGIAELLLGTVIATGWKTRYASALVLLGTLAAISSVMPFHTVSAEIRPSAAALIVSSCLLVCFGRNNAFRDRFLSAEFSRGSRLESKATCTMLGDAGVKVTVRLENPPFPNLHKRRCIVTFHELSGRTRKMRKEVWYAKDDCQPGRSPKECKQNESPNGAQITQNERP